MSDIIEFVEGVLDLEIADYQKKMLKHMENMKSNKSYNKFMSTSRKSGITYTKQLFDQCMFHKK